ncbi:MAG: dienelactone hydrolase family protein [Actinomycetota bacterium]|nr:dienelactone hydrolase family protein [Actinomycetota bacterium]
MDETIDFPTDGGTTTATGRLFAAAGGAGLGVLVLPDDEGLTPHVRDLCGRLVEEGFTALAPDVTEPPAADLRATAETLVGAADRLRTHDAVRGEGVAVLGFGRGAGLALWLAFLLPGQVRAVVPFYGLPREGSQPDLDRIDAAVEGHFAENDDTVPPGAVQALETELADLGKDVRMFTYPGTSHGFFDDTRADRYDAEAARQAWVRTLEFLRAKLG